MKTIRHERGPTVDRCIDPELGVDIVSLSLVYGSELSGRTVAVLATTTTPACPLGNDITAEIERVLLSSGAVDQVAVEITHSPRGNRT